jgi:anti-sigma factor RsiW
MAHLSPQLQHRFLARLLSPEETLDVVKHLRECEACRERLLALRSDKPGSLVDAILPEVSDEEHPSADSLGAYLDGDLSGPDKADLEEHLRTCELCRKASADLRSFRHELLQSPAQEYLPAEKISSSSQSVPGNGWFGQKGLHFLAWFNRPLVLAAVATIAAAILVAGIVLVRSPETFGIAGAGLGPQVRVTDGSHWIALGPNGIRNPPVGLSREVLTALNDVAASVLKNEQLSLSSRVKDNLAALKRAPSVLLGQQSAAAPFQLLSPVRTLVESVRPTFKWTAANDATSYVVHVVADDQTQEEAATSPVIMPIESETTACQWALPESMALGPGKRYRWYVTATIKDQEVDAPGMEQAQAKFAILSDVDAADLNALRQTARGDRLIDGVLRLNAGLLDAAQSDFEYLLADPSQSAAAKDVLNRMIGEIRRLKNI